MINYEKYQNEIIEILASSNCIAVRYGKPCRCDGKCAICDLSTYGGSCSGDKLKDWFLEDADWLRQIGGEDVTV